MENENNNATYNYSEATAGFYVVLLVIVALGFVIRVHSEVRFPFSTRDLPVS